MKEISCLRTAQTLSSLDPVMAGEQCWW